MMKFDHIFCKEHTNERHEANPNLQEQYGEESHCVDQSEDVNDQMNDCNSLQNIPEENYFKTDSRNTVY